MAITAAFFLLDMRLADFARHKQCFDRRRMCVIREQQNTNTHQEYPCSAESPMLSSHARSIDIDCNHMHDPSDQQHEEERQMQYMPE